jgi:uncharacterized RDD family membrane protein YckC
MPQPSHTPPPHGHPPPPPPPYGGPPPLPPSLAREIITNEAFAISPQLLGLPLARPGRRLLALLIDLAIVAILVQAGGAFLFAVAAAFAFFRFASRGRGSRGMLGKTARFTFRALGAIVLFSLSISLYHRVMDEDEEDGDGGTPAQMSMAGGQAPKGATPMAVVRFLGEIKVLNDAEDEPRARRAAERLVKRMRELNMSESQIREALGGAIEDSDKPFMRAAVDSALAHALPPDTTARAKPLAPDSLAILYAAAVRAGAARSNPAPADTASADTAAGDTSGETSGERPARVAAAEAGEDGKRETAADTLGARLGSILARDSLDRLRGQVTELKQNEGELKKQLEDEKSQGLLASLLKFLDDLGLSFGWNALYFTAFTALWKGQTPGKKLLGIRVLRLNGQPMTLWASFERFGGYAAGLLTGLLGFAQVFWDRNRMAIHDKITETVVVRERRGTPAPPAASAPAGAAARYPQNV